MKQIGRFLPYWHRAVPTLTLIVGTGLSLFAFYEAKIADDARVRSALELRSEWRASDFHSKISDAAVPIEALSVSIASYPDISAAKFHRLALQARGTDPIVRLAWWPRVSRAGRAAFEQAARADAPDFTIRESNPAGGFAPAGDRSEYFPMQFEERFGNLAPLLGYDLMSESFRRTASARARDEGTAIATRVLPAIGEETTPRYAVFWPVYRDGVVPASVDERRANLLGFVGGLFDVDAVFNFAISDTPHIVDTLNLFIDPPPRALFGTPVALYLPDTHKVMIGSQPIGEADPNGLRTVRSFNEFGRDWTLVFDYPPAVVAALSDVARWGYLLLGMLLTLLITAFETIEQRRRLVIEATVAERTRDLRRAGDQLKAMIEASPLALGGVGPDGRVTLWNRTAEQIFGYSAEEVIGRPYPVVPGEDAETFKRRFERVAKGEIVRDTQARQRRKDGTLIDVRVFAAAYHDSTGDLLGVMFALEDITERKQWEEAQSRLVSIVNSSDDAIIGKTLDGIITSWNPGAEKIFGYSAAEVTGKPLLVLFPPERLDEEKQILARIRAGAGVDHFETVRVRKGGKRIDIAVTLSPIIDQNGKIIGASKIARDITERKQAEVALRASEERYRTTLDSILEGCQLIGSDWRYLYLNDAAAVHNRRPNAELLGKEIMQVWPGIEAAPVFDLLRRSMQERIALHGEIEFVFPDQSTGWFDVRSQPVPEGIFVLSIDITERKHAEMALRELNESLELRVATRTAELHAALVRAEDADRIKSAFLATMSHELRTPLNSILGFTGIILQGLAGPLNPEQTKQLGMVRGSARHLLDLINDVLDISKIEAGQMEVKLEPFDLRASIEHVTGLVTPMAHRKGLVLSVTAPSVLPPIVSDRRRLEQILINLLNNAVKFTEHGTVSVVVELVSGFDAAPPGQPCVRIQVADTGIGIKPEELSALFEPFRQLDSGLTRQYEGTGLGLAICRRLAVLLDGDVRAESTWGSGSVFTVTLPMNPGT